MAREKGGLTQAIALFSKAQQLSASSGDWVQYARAAALQAEAMSWSMKPDSARWLLGKAEEVCTQQAGNNHPSVWMIKNMRLEVIRLEGKGNKAIKNEEVLTTYWKNQSKTHPEGLGTCYLYLGKIRSDLGDFGGAVRELESAELIFKASAGQQQYYLQDVYAFLCNAYTFLGEREKALSCLNKAQDLARQYNPSPHFRTANLHRLRGTLGALGGDFEEAIAEYRVGLQELEYYPEMKEQKAVLWSNLSLMLGKTGAFEPSIQAAETAQAIYEEGYGKKHQKLVKVFSNLAISHETRNDYTQAYRYSRRALQCLAPDWTPRSDFDLPGPETFNNTFLFLLKMTEAGKYAQAIYESGEDQRFLETAFKAYDWTVEAIDRMRNELQTEDAQLSFQNYEQFRDCYDYALHAAWMLYEKTEAENYLQKALAYTEKRKSGLLYAALQKRRALQFSKIPPALLEQEQQLKSNLKQARTAYFEAQTEATGEHTLLTLRSKMQEADAQHNRFLHQLDKDYPEYYEVRYAPTIPSLADLKSYLRKNESTLLEYYVGGEADSALYIIRVDGKNCTLKRLPIDSTFALSLKDYLAIISDPSQTLKEGNDFAYFQNLCDKGHQLYKFLLDGVLQAEDRNLIVIPSDILYYLPFETLLENPSSETKVNYSGLNWVLKNHTVRYGFSTGVMMAAENKYVRVPHFFAGFAPDAPGSSSMALPSRSASALRFAPEEVRTLSQMLNGTAFIGSTSNLKNLREAAQQYRILHIASHAVTDEENPLLSYISLGDTVRLSAYEIYDWQMASEMAVLSACNTGSGLLAGGEGVMSIARAFRYAGCPNLLVSLWQVDDESTREIMQSFYRHLKAGEAKHIALHHAKLDYLAAKHKTHPYFWAPFVLLGDNYPIEKGQNWPISYLVGGALALLAVVGGMIWWRRRRRHSTVMPNMVTHFGN
jgi:CHAT domain-containing protein